MMVLLIILAWVVSGLVVFLIGSAHEGGGFVWPDSLYSLALCVVLGPCPLVAYCVGAIYARWQGRRTSD